MERFCVLILVLSLSLNLHLAAMLFPDSSTKAFHDSERSKILDRDYKDKIIESALSLELPATDKIISEKATKLLKKTYQKVGECHYEDAINIVVGGLKKLPTNFALQAELASLLGDCSEITPAPLKDRMVHKAKRMFDRLMQEVDGHPKGDVNSFKNEYYFRFALYREQYEFGLKRVSDSWQTLDWEIDGIRGYYSQGVGAARYAQKLIKEDNKPLVSIMLEKQLLHGHNILVTETIIIMRTCIMHWLLEFLGTKKK